MSYCPLHGPGAAVPLQASAANSIDGIASAGFYFSGWGSSGRVLRLTLSRMTFLRLRQGRSEPSLNLLRLHDVDYAII